MIPQSRFILAFPNWIFSPHFHIFLSRHHPSLHFKLRGQLRDTQSLLSRLSPLLSLICMPYCVCHHLPFRSGRILSLFWFPSLIYPVSKLKYRRPEKLEMRSMFSPYSHLPFLFLASYLLLWCFLGKGFPFSNVFSLRFLIEILYIHVLGNSRDPIYRWKTGSFVYFLFYFLKKEKKG